MDKFMQYLIMAGKKALDNAGITEEIMNELEKSRCGVLIGSAMGGMKVQILAVHYDRTYIFSPPAPLLISFTSDAILIRFLVMRLKH